MISNFPEFSFVLFLEDVMYNNIMSKAMTLRFWAVATKGRWTVLRVESSSLL